MGGGGFTGAFGKGGLHHFTLGVEGILCDALNILRSFGDTLGFNRGRQALRPKGKRCGLKLCISAWNYSGSGDYIPIYLRLGP